MISRLCLAIADPLRLAKNVFKTKELILSPMWREGNPDMTTTGTGLSCKRRAYVSVHVGIVTNSCSALSGRSSCCALVNAGRNTGRKGRNGEEHRENGLRRGETLGERPNLGGTPAEEPNRGETRGEMAEPGRNAGRNGRRGETGENKVWTRKVGEGAGTKRAK